MPRRFLLWALASASATLLTVASAQALPAYCPGPDALPADRLAPPSLLAGANFEVDACARLVGHMGQFVLRPRFPAEAGLPKPPVLAVESLDLLAQRVVEMEALQRLQAISRAAAAGDAAWTSLQQTGSAVGTVITRPVESVIGLPAGALRFAGRRAGELGRQIADAGERAGEAMADAAAEDGLRLRPGAVPPPMPEAEPWWAAGGSLALRHGRRWLGYSAARRDLAERLELDPYSGNPWLDAEMDRLAWAALVGRRGVGLGLGQLGPAAGTTLSASGRIHRMVWQNSPEEVARWNRGRLAVLRCASEARDEFFDNPRFSPSLQSAAVDALLNLAPQQGCELPLRLAAGVQREVDARYLVDSLQLLAAAQPQFPLHFETIGQALVLRDGEQRLWLAMPVDHLLWTSDARAYFEAPGFEAVADRHLLLGRSASPEARGALLARGWSLIEDGIEPARAHAARLSAEALW